MLLDIHMPQLTGLDVMARAVPRPPFPVLAMTGQVDLESIEQYRCVPRPRMHSILVLVLVLLFSLDCCRVLRCCCARWFAFTESCLRLPCSASGFTGCLCKPFDLEGLKSSLRKSQDGAWFSV
jgi:CheY-like chemotaxis protein